MNQQTQPHKNSEEFVRDWLEKRGFVMELKTAHLLRKAGFDVSNSVGYADPTTGETREIDLVALRNDIWGFGRVGLCVECKGHASPWVLFSESASGHRTTDDFAFFSPAMRSILRSEASAVSLRESSLLSKRGANHGARMAGNGTEDIAYKASMSAVNACIDLSEDTGDEDDHPSFNALIPVVVVNGPVFICWIEKDEIATKEVNYARYSFGAFSSSNVMVDVWIVNFQNLEAFANEARAMVEKLWHLIPSVSSFD